MVMIRHAEGEPNYPDSIFSPKNPDPSKVAIILKAQATPAKNRFLHPIYWRVQSLILRCINLLEVDRCCRMMQAWSLGWVALVQNVRFQGEICSKNLFFNFISNMVYIIFRFFNANIPREFILHVLIIKRFSS